MDAETYDKYFIEIQMVMRRYHAASVGLEGPELHALRRKENEALLDVLQQQKRALAFAAGEQVAPMVHYGEAVIIGQGGQ